MASERELTYLTQRAEHDDEDAALDAQKQLRQLGLLLHAGARVTPGQALATEKASRQSTQTRKHSFPFAHRDVPPPKGRARTMFREQKSFAGELPARDGLARRLPQYGFVAQFAPLYTDKRKFYYYELPHDLGVVLERAWLSSGDQRLLFCLIPRKLAPPTPTDSTLDFPLAWFDGGSQVVVQDVQSGSWLELELVTCFAGEVTGRRRHVALLVVHA